jgi:transcriptional regulator NrdR family protein
MSNLKCPKCRNKISLVLATREDAKKTKFRRRRECNECKKRFSTVEQIEYAVTNLVINGFIVAQIVPWDFNMQYAYRGTFNECEKYIADNY